LFDLIKNDIKFIVIFFRVDFYQWFKYYNKSVMLIFKINFAKYFLAVATEKIYISLKIA